MRKNFFKMTLTAAFALALALIFFGCGGDGGGSDGDLSSSGEVTVSSSSSDVAGSSSLNSEDKYAFCVLVEHQICLSGSFSSCDGGGLLSNTCPYDIGSSSSSGEAISDSSSVELSSSSVEASSSSVEPSSSSLVPSSSSVEPSSSSLVPSSSSIELSSSSVAIVPLYGETVIWGGEEYKTVIIGTQTWFARNLNVNGYCFATEAIFGYVDGEYTITEKTLTTEEALARCEKYGRMYRDDNTSHCPTGWRVPGTDDWNTLFEYIDDDVSFKEGTARGSFEITFSSNISKHLKAKEGWDDNNDGISGNGEDTYGFAALPGGYGYSDGSLSSVGTSASWISIPNLNIPNYNRCNDESGYLRSCIENAKLYGNLYSYAYISRSHNQNSGYHSIRCIKGSTYVPNGSSSSGVVTYPSSSSVVVGNLTISGCPYTTSNANANVHAISGSVSSVSSYLSQAISAAGSGIIASSNTVTWTGTKVPDGTFTIVLDILQGGNLTYYKASGVSLRNGAGSVSWSSFSEFK